MSKELNLLYSNEIISLTNIDLDYRDHLIKKGLLSESYHPEMEKIHIQNSIALEKIIDQIGYPTAQKVGEEASESAWLIIQHSISRPRFMEKCVSLLSVEVAKSKANPIHLAYLTDRILSFKGELQLYGTAFDWDENGLMSPKPYDNLDKVNSRRRGLGLNSLDEQIVVMRKQALSESSVPPKNLPGKNRLYDAWRKRVGWI